VVFFTGSGIGGLDSLTVDCVKLIVDGSHADLTLLSALAIRFLNFGSPLRIFVRFDNIFCCDIGSDSVASIIRFLIDTSRSGFKVGLKYFGGLCEIVFDGGCHTRSRVLDEADSLPGGADERSKIKGNIFIDFIFCFFTNLCHDSIDDVI
jgi:hypothetical protein